MEDVEEDPATYNVALNTNKSTTSDDTTKSQTEEPLSKRVSGINVCPWILSFSCNSEKKKIDCQLQDTRIINIYPHECSHIQAWSKLKK